MLLVSTLPLLPTVAVLKAAPAAAPSFGFSWPLTGDEGDPCCDDDDDDDADSCIFPLERSSPFAVAATMFGLVLYDDSWC